MSTDKEDTQLSLIIGMINEQKQDFKALRDSSHDIRDELGRVTGLFDLVRQNVANEKERTERDLKLVNSNIRETRASMKELAKDIEAREKELAQKIELREKELDKRITDSVSTIKDIKPRLDAMHTTYTWVARIVVVAIVGGLIGLLMNTGGK